MNGRIISTVKNIMLGGMIILLPLAASACSSKAAASGNAEPARQEVKQTVDAFGTIKANNIENIIIDFPSSVIKVHVKEGQKVGRNDVLVTLNTNEYAAQITKKELELATAKNEMDRLGKNYVGSSQSPELKKLQNDLQNAESLYRKALNDLDAKKKLFDAGSVSKSELDEFTRLVDEKQKNVNDIKFSIDSIKYDKNTEAGQKATQIAMLETDLKVMKDKLAKTYIRGNEVVSNLNRGIAYEIGYTTGDFLTYEKKLLSVMDLDSLVVKADVDEEFIKDVRTGAPVTIIPTADKTRTYAGKVAFISDKAVQKNNITMIPVEISIENADEFLLPEFNVDVKIDMQK